MVAFFRAVGQYALHDIHHVMFAMALSIAFGLTAWGFGREPDAIEVLWVFACIIGILFHWETLAEIHRDRAAVMRHPSSTDVDIRNLGDHIRSERLRITAKSLFLYAGGISLYFLPRNSEAVDWLRLTSVAALAGAVIVLDIDAITDRISRRRLVVLIKQEIEARPFGLSTEARLDQAIIILRDLYHAARNLSALAIGADEKALVTGTVDIAADISERLRAYDRLTLDIRDLHDKARALDPKAGGDESRARMEVAT